MQHLTMTDDELDALLATGEIPVALRWVSAERIKGSTAPKQVHGCARVMVL